MRIYFNLMILLNVWKLHKRIQLNEMLVDLDLLHVWLFCTFLFSNFSICLELVECKEIFLWIYRWAPSLDHKALRNRLLKSMIDKKENNSN
jgi:hypothetical protein